MTLARRKARMTKEKTQDQDIETSQITNDLDKPVKRLTDGIDASSVPKGVDSAALLRGAAEVSIRRARSWN